MLDPIGGFNRLRDFFISYLETAFRVRDLKLTADRRRLLLEVGTLTASPFLEPVPRYKSADYRLEDLVTRGDDNPLASLTEKARIAFVDLALSGLFPGKDAEEGLLLRKSDYAPYRHQVQMLEREYTTANRRSSPPAPDRAKLKPSCCPSSPRLRRKPSDGRCLRKAI